eukprot:7745401-Ditylum_brightwellii.AAC.1
MLGIHQTRWYTLRRHLDSEGSGLIAHHLAHNTFRTGYGSLESCCQSIREYLNDVKEGYGEGHASLFILSKCRVELKNSE